MGDKLELFGAFVVGLIVAFLALYFTFYLLTKDPKWWNLVTRTCNCPPASPNPNQPNFYNVPNVMPTLDTGLTERQKEEASNTLEKAQTWLLGQYPTSSSIVCPANDSMYVVLVWSETQNTFYYGMGHFVHGTSSPNYTVYAYGCSQPEISLQ